MKQPPLTGEKYCRCGAIGLSLVPCVRHICGRYMGLSMKSVRYNFAVCCLMLNFASEIT